MNEKKKRMREDTRNDMDKDMYTCRHIGSTCLYVYIYTYRNMYIQTWMYFNQIFVHIFFIRILWYILYIVCICIYIYTYVYIYSVVEAWTRTQYTSPRPMYLHFSRTDPSSM